MTGPIIPGMVAMVLENPIMSPAYCGARSRKLALLQWKIRIQQQQQQQQQKSVEEGELSNV